MRAEEKSQLDTARNKTYSFLSGGTISSPPPTFQQAVPAPSSLSRLCCLSGKRSAHTAWQTGCRQMKSTLLMQHSVPLPIVSSEACLRTVWRAVLPRPAFSMICSLPQVKG